jgi:hypothetical protein
MSSRLAHLAAVCGLALVTGCGGRAVVMPQSNALWTQGRTVDAGFVCTQFLDRTPLPSFDREPRESFVVGMSNWHFPGAEPVPCWRRHEYRAIGLVRWDLRIAQGLLDQGYTLDRAELVQRLDPRVTEWGGGWAGSDLAEVRVAAAGWEAIDRVGDPDDPSMTVAAVGGDPLTSVPFRTNPGELETSDDVTDLVRRWLRGDLPNHGLIFDSVTFGLGEEVSRTMETGVRAELRLFFREP